MLAGVVPEALLIPALGVLLVLSGYKVWHHELPAVDVEAAHHDG
ncbi:MAG TPA: hypothetical protein PKA87_05420 [Microthrixaceae bacterium]|nr:hypothetical protein [Microthrixaceae bacterium]HMX06961.1 hypothetical protein [Microthrixaceae bacterium]HMY85901.1 hypothetical protein [Microthrixaceae bacterium]HNA36657.1 hypothetical protein [Microthrixaceae bacterium]HNE75717.1 hypothetical protein [Microthrixaceae bacterium]